MWGVLLGRPAAIQRKAGPSDIPGRITGQKQGHIRDLLGHQKLTSGMFFTDHRNPGFIIRQACFLGMRTNLPVNKLCQNKSRANRITGNIRCAASSATVLVSPTSPCLAAT